MEVGKVNSINTINTSFKRGYVDRRNEVAFKAAPSSGASKYSKNFWLGMRRIADGMKDITEIKNAFIAAIGTGIIAPAIILVSPGKGDEEDKNKKKIQAIRQPISAALALGFQVPTTMFINREIDKLAYKKKIKFFKDDVIGDLVPSEKHIAKGVTKAEIEALGAKFEDVIEGKALREELEAIIKKHHKEVGLEMLDKDFNKRMVKDKEKFLRQKIASQKIQELKELKVQDILAHPEKYPKLANIKDVELVTEDLQERVAEKYKGHLKNMEKDANLSFFDKTVKIMGFETKKTTALENAKKAFKREKALELLKEESPDIFKDKSKKLRKFIDAYQKESEKVFVNKKFWISLLVNLFMVTASCYALNWLHPRVNKYFENRQAEKKANAKQKVEVK